MAVLLVFGFLLLIAVLLSGVAERSILSIAVLFLVAGFALGEGGVGVLHVQPETAGLTRLIEIAIFAVLFTDSMNFSLGQIRAIWDLPGRALFLGMPLTLVAIAALAHWLTGLTWLEAFLVGAVLSPTDPIFAAAIVKQEQLSQRLRQLLNIESGLNDGLALPAVLLTLAMLTRQEQQLWLILAELAWGALLGTVVAYLAILLLRALTLPPAGSYKPLYAFAIGLLIFGLAEWLHANLFFAAFAAGVTIATACPAVRDAFADFGEAISELLKLAALLSFGALLTWDLLRSLSLTTDSFAVLTIFLARPLVIELVLLGSVLPWQERAVIAWFGPKGFASIFYGLLVLHQAPPNADYMTRLIAIVITFSIILHSSTDVLLARWLQTAQAEDAAI